MKKLRIAQVAPLWERVPPPAYGGTELVVSYLADELVRRGHEVTLFASGDSETLATLESVHSRALRLDADIREYQVYELMQLGRVYEQAENFDIIHCHVEFMAHPIASLVKTPTVYTLHKITPDNRKLFAQYRHHQYISISLSQQAFNPSLNYLANVYNGIDPERHPFKPQAQDPPYLAFLGRMSPEKGPHHAIHIAKETGWHLKMAGKIDAPIQEFFEQEIQPYIDGRQIEFLGEFNLAQKVELLGNAAITLHPVTYQEPFGLVMIESMCTGTPVLALNLGSIPEVIAHGKTGFVCQTPAEMISMLPAALALDRRACREHVEQHFSIAQMVDGYEMAYRKALNLD
jgi:glycosyltransferase involved in cell wall biosynthesis